MINNMTIPEKIMDAVLGTKEWFAKSKERFEAYNDDHDCHLSPDDGCSHPSHPQI